MKSTEVPGNHTLSEKKPSPTLAELLYCEAPVATSTTIVTEAPKQFLALSIHWMLTDS